MATYHLHVSSGSKSNGKGAGGKARYLLREGPYAREVRRVADGGTVREAVADKSAELLFSASGNLPAWADGDPHRFWDASDAHERANGSTYREVEVALPREISQAQQIALAQAFAWAVAQVDGGVTPWTLAVHQQDPAHPEHRHVHILLSDRIQDGEARTPETFFKRYNAKDPGKGGARKSPERQDTKVGAKWTDRLRPLWEHLANEALQQAGLDVRIDHRTLEQQREEQEALAEQAKRVHHEIAALQHTRSAEALDRPPEPKKGRVLTHAGPEKAPGRAAMVVDFESAKAARAQAVEVRRLAEAVVAQDRQAMEQHERIMEHARVRQGYRLEPWRIREEWSFRQQMREQQRQDEQLEFEQHETRLGKEAEQAREAQHSWLKEPLPMMSDANVVRERRKTPWREWREKTLEERYGDETAQRAVQQNWYIRMRPDLGGLHIRDKEGREVIDTGSIIKAEHPRGVQDIPLMLDLARAKGWRELVFMGSDDFRLAAASAALRAGFSVSDKVLEKAAQREIEREFSMPYQDNLHEETHQAPAPSRGKGSSSSPGDDWW